MSEKMYNVGKVVNTHGIRGEVKVLSLTDFPGVRFFKGGRLLFFDPSGAQKLEVEIEQAREHKGMYILKLVGYGDINEVEKYKGWMVKVGESELVELEEDEYFFHEIVGCQVIDEEGVQLGEIKEILTPGANDVWVVKRQHKRDLLIPVIDDVLVSVDVGKKLVTIRLMEGLDDL